LAVERRGVVDKKVDIQDGFRRNDGFIERDTNDFGKTGSAARHFVVIWYTFAACVTALYYFDTFDAPKNSINAPETSSAEYVCRHVSIIPRYNEGVKSDEFKKLIQEKGRELYRTMPWRDDTRPYYVLVSELMLQQTQVERVIPKFEAFIKRFPDETALSGASLGDVLTLWSGLGYNRRAKFLHEAAKMIVATGMFPDSKDQLLALPGVGNNTAGAIMTYVHNQPVPFIETNVRTVYFYHFFENGDKVSDAEILPLIDMTIDTEYPREFYWALMDYGAWLKKQGVGTIRQSTHYKKQSALKGSVREVRGQIIRSLTKQPKTESVLRNELLADERFEPALTGLKKDGLVMQTAQLLHLTK